MTTKASQGKNSLINEKSSYEEFQIAAKNMVFGFLHLMMKDKQNSKYFAIASLLIQYLQIHYFIFYKSINNVLAIHRFYYKVWQSDEISNGLNQIFGYLQLVLYFQYAGLDAYVSFFFVLFGIQHFFIYTKAFILLTILSVLYFSYQFAKSNIKFSLPISILRIILQLWNSILFMPIVDYFMNIWDCSQPEDSSKAVHSVYSELECWNGMHIVYVSCSVFILILFVSIGIGLSLTFFECRVDSNDPTAKVNGRANAVFLSYIVVLEIVYKIMPGDQFVYIILGLIFGGSLIIFSQFALNQIYHDHQFQMFQSVLASINIWSAIMLCLAKIMEGQVFQGSIIAWMIGIPFIIGIVLTNRDRQIEALIINVNKFANGEEMMSQLRYLLKLLKLQSTSRHSAILLDGYIEVHKQTCNKEDCPLKQKKNRNSRVTRAIMLANEDIISEKYALLLQLIYKMYYQGIRKFANNTDLRLAYAFFLLDKMKYKQQALQELNMAESFRPSLDVQFIIYRYKRIIEQEIQEQRHQGKIGNLEVFPSSAAPPMITALAQQIEKSALLHMEFWSQLGEDTPDLGKLEQIGRRVMNSIEEVEQHWNKLQKISPNHQKSLRIYSKYLLEILNDQDSADRLMKSLAQLQTSNQNQRNYGVYDDESQQDDYSNDPMPVFTLATENEKFGYIIGLNQSGASLFHYSKSELINQRVTTLMPKLYAKYHDQIVENFLNQNEAKQYSRDRTVYGKTKLGYIMQLSLNIKMINLAMQGVSFIGTFGVEKNLRPVAYILTDELGNLEGVSQGCISLLKFDFKFVQQKKTLNDLLPGLYKDRAKYLIKGGGIYIYNLPKELIELQERFAQNMQFLQEIEASVTLICSIQELNISTQQNSIGYVYRFEKNNESTNLSGFALNHSMHSKKSNNLLLPKQEKKQNQGQFYFHYILPDMTVIGEYGDHNQYSEIHTQRVDDSLLMQNRGFFLFKKNSLDDHIAKVNLKEINLLEPNMESNKKKNEDQKEEFGKIKYDEGIRTLRLFNGKVGEIEEINEEEIMQEDQDEFEQNKCNFFELLRYYYQFRH